MPALRPLLALLLALASSTATVAAADGLEGRWAIEGEGPEGACRGSAFVARDGDGWEVTWKTADRRDVERRARCRVAIDGVVLRLAARAQGNDHLTERELVTSGRVEDGALRLAWRDADGRVARREVWRRDDDVTIPLAIAGVGGHGALPGVTEDELRRLQPDITAQLEAVYLPLRIRFRMAGAPTIVPGDEVDRDGDGRLATKEVMRLRDALEVRGLKRPGRVVLVLTAADLVGRGCRGWTLGDAPATSATLGDWNDNFSLVGSRYLDGERFHTVPHEVGHQLGLDDVVDGNRSLLARPDRGDQLMASGGHGVFLDPAMARLVRRNALLPDHGLEGRRHTVSADDPPPLDDPDEPHGHREPGAGIGPPPPGGERR